jgi:thioredoxin-related protein
MIPMVHGLEKRYAGRIDFVYLNAEDEKTAAVRDKYEFVGTPQFVLLDAQGKQVGKHLFGLLDEAVLTAALDALAAGR